MSKKHLLKISLLLPLMAISATANAGSTITDKSYWPNEDRQSAHKNSGSQNDLTSAFVSDRTTSRFQPAPNTNDGGSRLALSGRPKISDDAHWRQVILKMRGAQNARPSSAVV
jgi:hypothetical protein